MSAVDRKYRYRRIAPGVVLLPGNDGDSLFAVARYMDGPSFGLEGEPRDFTAWGWGRLPQSVVGRLRALFQADPEAAIDLARDWGADNRWPRHKTMREAMGYALASAQEGN